MPKQITDPAIGEPKSPATIEPKDFDLEAWLSGLAPAKAHYHELPGVTIEMQAKTARWINEFRESVPEDADDARVDLELLAEHIVSPAMTADDLERLKAVRGPEVQELLGLMMQLDTRPESQIAPRFLPKSSD